MNTVKDLLKFFVGFIPWIAFGALAGPSFAQLETAIVISLALALLVGFRELRKGFILTWGTLIFFLFLALFVVVLKNIWVMRHLGVLAPTMLAAIAWTSLFLGRPFVYQIACESTPREHWNSPSFKAGCRYMTIVWGTLFLFSAAVAFAKFMKLGGPDWLYQALSFGSIVFGITYTEYYKMKKRAQTNATPKNGAV